MPGIASLNRGRTVDLPTPIGWPFFHFSPYFFLFSSNVLRLIPNIPAAFEI
jgi:hypothetical protein